MTTHISARLAWHDNGWNGHICQNPSANSYCVGQFSYPGEMIAEQRKLELEVPHAGEGCPTNKETYIPPCVYSLNAFGDGDLTAYAKPPDFFHDETRTRFWRLKPATVCIWPYEVMYGEDVQKGERSYDYEKRLANAKEYFDQFEKDRSLIFYYSNYSNPFSEDDNKHYVVVGISRLKELGDILYYENCSQRVKERYAGGFIWQLSVSSHYPDQGFRIPYHLYQDRPEVLDKILLIPDNSRNFKYATREISDDDALGLVERLIEIGSFLGESGDTSEDWKARVGWLQTLIGDLWKSRGLYPGVCSILNYLEFEEANLPFKKQVEQGKEQDAKEAVFALLDGKCDSPSWLKLHPQRIAQLQDTWRKKGEEAMPLLRDVLPRFELGVDQIQKTISPKRTEQCSVRASLAEIAANPYILSEQYVGAHLDDLIPLSKIDHGVFPSPNLGGSPLGPRDDWRRLRALLVARLKRESKHTFLPADQIIEDVNLQLKHLPEWKRAEFTEHYLSADERRLSDALTFREWEGRRYLYLASVHEDERAIETGIRDLSNLPDIRLKIPVTEAHWHDFVYDEKSRLARKHPKEYEAAIQGQIQVSRRIFASHLEVLCGAAGTGKTTIIKALIKAIRKVEGEGAPFQLLAPTGKAVDRLREITGHKADTIHSFLNQRGWLNDNLTFKREGGQCEENARTLIVDEASMVDLELMAALFRSVNWASAQRLILVGDPNQLPPIGRGRVFADVIGWLRANHPEKVGYLEENIRQLENRLEGLGTGILDLASLYIRRAQSDTADEDWTAQVERVIQKLQGPPPDGNIDKDLRVLYWKDAGDLHRKLADAIRLDMQNDTGKTLDPDRPYQLWREAFKNEAGRSSPDYQQILSPYRGEPFGTEQVNSLMQKEAQGGMLKRIGELGGITLFDKVIQYRNRGKSDSLWAYNVNSGHLEQVEVFNGELGFVKPHGYDKQEWTSRYFFFRRFQVVFSRHPEMWVNYGSDLGKKDNTHYLRSEKVEENLELAYAISVHKAQGSEFQRVYFVVPKHKRALLSTELFYTGLTRARRHCTLLIEEDVSPLLWMLRPEASHLIGINSSLFAFQPLPDKLVRLREWYEEGKVYETLTEYLVRSKSEVIIANLLSDRGIPFKYEMPLYAPDGTFYLPDFTINWHGEDWYWEHLGLRQKPDYARHWEEKETWYKEHGFWDHVILSEEGVNLAPKAADLIAKTFGVIVPQDSLVPQKDSDRLADLIARGEGPTLEFKESLEADIATGESKPALVVASLKTIDGFLNTEGGTLLLGVADSLEIKGLEKDYQLIPKRPNSDGFENKLRNLLESRFDPAPLGKVHIHFDEMPEGTVCRVEVQKSDAVIHLDNAVYVRDGNRTIKLEGRKLTDWISMRARS